MPDPNPKVSGRGFDQLRAAGIQVEVGPLQSEARKLNEAFARYVRHGLPLVTLKSAMTLDAKIAPAGIAEKGGIDWITGESARAHVHELRHRSDALLVGIGTILADDPLLTDRSNRARRRPLLRIVLDSQLRTPLDSRLLASVADDVLIFYCAADDDKKRALETRGARIERVAANSGGRIDLPAVLGRLAELEITSVMIEGGSTINAAALASGMVDKVFLYYAPQIMGSGVPFIAEAGVAKKLGLQQIVLHRFDRDIAIEAYLRDPYEV